MAANILVLEGVAASIGPVGDAGDNAPARTRPLVQNRSGRAPQPVSHPPRHDSSEHVGLATMDDVDRYRNDPLHHQLGYIRPDEYGAAFYAHSGVSWPPLSEEADLYLKRFAMSIHRCAPAPN